MDFVKLRNGVELPLEGYGVFQIPKEECVRCVLEALSVGYRLIDTAAAYMNEESVGTAIRNSGIPREEVFITTKLWVQDTSYDGAKRAFQTSLEKLGTDYLDLYLLHQPFGDYYGAWRAMEELYSEGKIRAIGVCNFDEARLLDLCLNQKIVPMVNQIEIHPFYQQERAIQIMRNYGIQPQAWGPLSEGQKNIFHNRKLEKIATKYERTVAQIILRWHIQRQIAIIPKSSQKFRMEENLNIWDFTLSNEDMKAIATMDIGHSEIINHYSACTARALNELKIHE